MRDEQSLLIDCLERLNRLGVPYMLVGSMASNFWGIPRTTHDLDYVIDLPRTDVVKFTTTFGEGFFLQYESVIAAYRPPHQFNAIDESSALKVDFWMLTAEPYARLAFSRRRSVTIRGVPASIATAEDVILNKFYWHLLSPSDRQLFDIAGVYAVQASALDRDYLRTWGEKLGAAKLVEDLLAGKIKPKAT